jgi:hypothetical protein
VFHRLSESDAAPLEEHLLMCDPCQAKLQQIDDFVLAMKQEASDSPLTTVSGGWWVRLHDLLRNGLALTPGRAALAGAMVVLSAVAVVDRPRAADGPPVAVTLKALRGGGAGFSATAPAGRPLALAIEVPDIAPCAQCRVEMVNDAGRTAWSGLAPITDGRLVITASVELGSGVYWVRLYTGGADPAREFGLRLE